MKTGQGIVSRGFEHKRVRIETVDSRKSIAICRDDFGRIVEVRTDVLRAKGEVPKVGEFWYVDRQYGGWTFALVVGNFKPGDGGGLQGRQTTSYITQDMTAGSVEKGHITLAKGFRILHIESTSPCRTRLYGTDAERDSDVARAISTPPGPGMGIILDYLTAPILLSGPLAPIPEGASQESTPSASIPISVTAVNGGVITVTLTWVRTE
jgi:hypothetical protein